MTDMELRRVEGLPVYVFDIVDEWKAGRVAAGADVIDFGIGSPDRPTPDELIAVLHEAADDPASHGYPTSPGLPAVREALAAWYANGYGVELDPATQTLVTWGASEALAHLPWVLLGPGDTALVPAPCYPIHEYAVRFSGARPVGVPMDEGDLMAAVERAWGDARPEPRVALLSFPHNPTTRCVDLAFFERLVDFAARRKLVLVHDFAYADIAFDGYRPPSILQVPGAEEVAVELVSLSKSHNMAGWRLGFVAGNARMIAGFARLKSYLDYGVTKPIQLMALAALRDAREVPAQMAAVYQARRDVLCDGLATLGWPIERPPATMFVWAAVPAAFRAAGSLAFAKLLLDEAGIAVSPGIGFGPAGEGHVRFALVQPRRRIAEALARLGPVLAGAHESA